MPVQLGYEIECYINSNSWDKFQNGIYKINKDIKIGDDGSIEPPYEDDDIYYDTAEIKTPPLSMAKSMNILKKVFRLVNQYGGTNDSCGFHVNISTSNKDKMLNFNPVTFLKTTLWSRILKEFNRENNDYCSDNSRKGKIRPMDLISRNDYYGGFDDGGKYSCVNFDNYMGCNKYSRIEIRGFGNDNYHRKLAKIKSYVQKIKTQFEKSC